MLAIDVGNTHIKTAIFDGPVVKDIIILSTEQCVRSGSFLELLPDKLPWPLQEVVISSVRKPITDIMLKEFVSKAATQPFIIDSNTNMGIENCYVTKATLGIDRLVNAAAAYHLYHQDGKPIIVVDMGTATTIDYIREDGAFIGGAIAPGLLSAYRGLSMNAPALPEIDITPADKVIGQSTHECIASGVIIAHAAMVREMARMMSPDIDPVVIITGGVSRLLDAWFGQGYIIDRELTLKGLRIIYELNA